MLIGLKQSDAVTSVGVASGRIGTPVNGRTTLIGCALDIKTMSTVCSWPSAAFCNALHQFVILPLNLIIADS